MSKVVLALLLLVLVAACNQEDQPGRSGKVLYRALNTPCGATAFESGELVNKISYAAFGHENEKTLNTLDFEARHYSAQLCQFLSVDPEDEDLSAYGYAGGNLLNVIDPDGRAIKIPAHRCAICGGAPFLKPAEANYLAPSFLVLRDVINVLARGVHWVAYGDGSLKVQVENAAWSATTGIVPIGAGMAILTSAERALTLRAEALTVKVLAKEISVDAAKATLTKLASQAGLLRTEVVAQRLIVQLETLLSG